MINRPISRWWTVAAGTLGGALGAGTIIAYMYGIMALPMGVEFGWDREFLGANTTAFLFGSGIGSVMLGFLISRYGIRAPAVIFVAIFGLSFALVAALPPVFWLYQMVFVIIGIGGAACTAMPYSVAISGSFNSRRGLALGIVVAGTGFGATFAPGVAQHLVEQVGWRGAFLTVGLVAGLLPVLALTFLVRTPRGVVSRRTADAEPPTPLARIATDPNAWKIFVPILFVSVAGWGAIGTLVPLFHDHRFSPATITAILSVAGLASWVARLVAGYLLDKFFAPYLCAAIFGLTAIGLVLLATTTTEFPAYAGAALVAMALGTEGDMVTYLVSRYFKLVDYSRLVGLLWVTWAWGGGIGTAIVLGLFQVTHSYVPTFLLFAGLLLAGAVVVCFLGPYRNPVHVSRGQGKAVEA